MFLLIFRCGLGQGDCDSDSGCQPGLVCGEDNGAHSLIGKWNVDVCTDQVKGGPFNSINTCSSSHRCGFGMGDCKHDFDCQDGLKCGLKNCRKFDQRFGPNQNCCF